MNSTSFKFMGAVLLLSVALVFSCKATGVDTAADDTTDTGTTMHTVSIVLNDGIGVSDQPQKVEDGKTFTIGNPNKAGYVFKGWSTTNQLSNLDFTSGNYAIKQDITIYAMFNKLYTVTIDPNGGTVKTPSYPVEAGSSLTLTDLPQKTLYTFGGYKNGTTSYTLNTPIVVNGDMTLTAQWSVDLYAVRDMLTGGTTTGVRWTYPTKSDQYILFKQVSTSSLEIDTYIAYGTYNNSLKTTLEASSNGALAQFNPPLSNPPYQDGDNAIRDIVNFENNSAIFRLNDGTNTTSYAR